MRVWDEKDERRQRNRKLNKKTDGTGCQPASLPYCCVSSHNSSHGAFLFLLPSSTLGLPLTLSQRFTETFPAVNSLTKTFPWHASSTEINRSLNLGQPAAGVPEDFKWKTFDVQSGCKEGFSETLESASFLQINSDVADSDFLRLSWWQG